jgi:AbrB family looped-hinge helix DNA binding protein
MGMSVTSKGQVTIPKKVRDFLGIRPGTVVEFRLEDGRVVLTRVGAKKPRSRLARLVGIGKSGMTTDEIMRLMRGED